MSINYHPTKGVQVTVQGPRTSDNVHVNTLDQLGIVCPSHSLHYTHTTLNTYSPTDIHMQTHIQTCTHYAILCMHTHTHYTYTHAHTLHIHIHIHVHAHTHTHCTHTYAHTHTHTAHIYTYYTHCTRARTHTHTHTHTRVLG